MAADLQSRLEAALAPRDEITLAYLFGASARGDASALSDVDVGVVLIRGQDSRGLGKVCG